jgi:hypothetical protein
MRARSWLRLDRGRAVVEQAAYPFRGLQTALKGHVNESRRQAADLVDVTLRLFPMSHARPARILDLSSDRRQLEETDDHRNQHH